MTDKKPTTVDGRLLRLEYNEETTGRHLNEVRGIGLQTSKDVTDIKNAIIGNPMNGDTGLVHEVRKVTLKQDLQEDILIEHKVYFKLIGVVLFLSVGALISVIAKVFFEHKG